MQGILSEKFVNIFDHHIHGCNEFLLEICESVIKNKYGGDGGRVNESESLKVCVCYWIVLLLNGDHNSTVLGIHVLKIMKFSLYVVSILNYVLSVNQIFTAVGC